MAFVWKIGIFFIVTEDFVFLLSAQPEALESQNDAQVSANFLGPTNPNRQLVSQTLAVTDIIYDVHVSKTCTTK